MVAYAQQTQRMRPMDTGAIFNGNVRVWLFTNDAMDAEACGVRLNELGLPQSSLRMFRPGARRWLFACNTDFPEDRIRKPDGTTQEKIIPLFYRGRAMILDTEEKKYRQMFYRWLHDKNLNVPQSKGPTSLKGLADAGEIETIDAG